MAYSDVEASEAMIRLAINKGDYDKTAEQTCVSVRTLKRWAKLAPKRGVPDLLERAIERMLMVIPTEWTGNQWAVAIGILMDKWLLLQGQPTSRMESVIRQLGEMTEDEYGDIVAEAERILAAATGGSADSGDGTEGT